MPGIELEILDRRCAIRLPCAETTDEHGRLGQVLGAFLSRQDETNCAIIDEAVIEETQRRDDEPRSLVVINCHRRFHDRVGMKLRMMAKGHGHFRELPRGCSVKLHVTPEHQRMRGAGGRKSPRIPISGRFIPAVEDAPRSANIGVKKRDIVCLPGGQGGCRFDEADARHPPVPGQGYRPARVEA